MYSIQAELPHHLEYLKHRRVMFPVCECKVTINFLFRQIFLQLFFEKFSCAGRVNASYLWIWIDSEFHKILQNSTNRIPPVLYWGQKKTAGILRLNSCGFDQSGWQDSNLRPHAPQTRTLNLLSYTPLMLLPNSETLFGAVVPAKRLQSYKLFAGLPNFFEKIFLKRIEKG